MTLQELQHEVRRWAYRNFPDAQPWFPLLGIMEEVGELSHAHLKKAEGVRDIEPDAFIDAVGDVVIFLCDYCNRNNIDMEAAVTHTWKHVKQRDWQKYPKTGRPE